MNGLSRYNYSHSLIDQKNQQGKVQQNGSLRAKLYQDIDRLVLKDLPLIYGIQDLNSYLGLDNLRGLERSVSPMNFGTLRYWELYKESSTNECPVPIVPSVSVLEPEPPEVLGFSGLLLIYSMVVMTLVMMLIRTRRGNFRK